MYLVLPSLLPCYSLDFLGRQLLNQNFLVYVCFSFPPSLPRFQTSRVHARVCVRACFVCVDFFPRISRDFHLGCVVDFENSTRVEELTPFWMMFFVLFLPKSSFLGDVFGAMYSFGLFSSGYPSIKTNYAIHILLVSVSLSLFIFPGDLLDA